MQVSPLGGSGRLIAELGFVLALAARGRLQLVLRARSAGARVGLVALFEPGGKALQVCDVLPGGALADLGVLGQKREKGVQRIIRRKRAALDSTCAIMRRVAEYGGESAPVFGGAAKEPVAQKSGLATGPGGAQ